MRYFFLLLVILLQWACGSKQGTAEKAQDVYYTCSMDPQVIEHKPGKCPICHMELTQVKETNGEDNNEIQLSEQQIQLGNIQTDTIRDGSIENQIVLTGILNFDQLKTAAVSARVMGRVEKLYFKNSGDYIKKGAPLYDLYSEELNNAKQEYLLVLEQKQIFANESAIDYDQLLKSAKYKLMLRGLTEGQIAELANNKKKSPLTTFYSTASGFITQLDIQEGEYLMEGGNIVKLADLSTLWVEAQAYASQMSEISYGSIATVQLPGFEGKEIRGKVEFINPEINPETRINLIRVSIPNPGNQLKPGMPAYVILKSPQRKTLTLPIDAVLRDGKGATVWVKSGTHSFKNKMVIVGLENNDRIEIRSGLKVGDIVVVSGAYLLQSEYIFKKGANPMKGHNMDEM